MNIPLRPLDQSYTSPLDQIRVAEPPAEVESTGRMSTGMCFTTYVQLGGLVERIGAVYSKVLEASPKGLDAELKDFISACEQAKQKAERLLASNKITVMHLQGAIRQGY